MIIYGFPCLYFNCVCTFYIATVTGSYLKGPALGTFAVYIAVVVIRRKKKLP